MSETASAPRPRGEALLSMLADRIGAQVRTSTVFGDPVERGDVTVVPLAAARFGLGAGSGSDPSKEQEGEGGGGGGAVTPMGYIEVKDGRSRYVPLVHPARMLALIAAAALAGLLIVRSTIVKPSRSRLLRR